MSSRPRVSVVMASYNHAPFVAQAVESALSQSFDDIELVITDDGSSDATADVIRGFRDARIRFEGFPGNQGACEATNHAIRRCRGEYVAILNSDDFFLPGKIQRQVALLDQNPGLGAVFGLPRFVDPQGRTIAPHRNPFDGIFTSAPGDRFGWLAHFLLRGNALCHPTILIRSEVYRRVGLYEPALRQLPDFDMWIRVCANFDIRVLDEELTAFRVLSGAQNTSAPSAKATRRAWWEEYRVLRRFLSIDDHVLMRAFRPHFQPDELARELPVLAMLGLLAVRQDAPFRQAFGLSILDDLVREGRCGLGPSELHAITGELNPFRHGWSPEVGGHAPRRRLSRRIKDFVRGLRRSR